MADADIEDVHDVTEPEDLEQHIERTRDDLAITIDAIADRVSPKRVASRGVASAKDAARTAMIAAQQKVQDLRAPKAGTDASGAVLLPNAGLTSYRVERRKQDPKILAGAVAAAGLVVGLLLRRHSRRH